MKPYTGPVWRVEGKPRLKLVEIVAGAKLETDYDWTPLEEYASQQTAETRLRYWKHEFPFSSLFVWRVSQVNHPPNVSSSVQ